MESPFNRFFSTPTFPDSLWIISLFLTFVFAPVLPIPPRLRKTLGFSGTHHPEPFFRGTPILVQSRKLQAPLKMSFKISESFLLFASVAVQQDKISPPHPCLSRQQPIGTLPQGLLIARFSPPHTTTPNFFLPPECPPVRAIHLLLCAR